MRSTEDFYEERIARYAELAEAAQDAAGRASTATLQETYAQLACQWARLAEMAHGMIRLKRSLERPQPVGKDDQRVH